MNSEKTINDFAGNAHAENAIKILLETNRSMCIAGHIATGKETLADIVQNEKLKQNKKVVNLALTYSFAKIFKGYTIYEYFNLEREYIVSVDSPRLQEIEYSESDVAAIRALDLIIIRDSMTMPGQLLDIMDYILKKVRKNKKPFGGVQMLFLVDHFISGPFPLQTHDKKDIKGAFFFKSSSYKSLKPLHTTLHICYGQFDPKLIDVIKGIRIKENIDTYHDLLTQTVERNASRDDKRIMIKLKKADAREANETFITEYIRAAHPEINDHRKIKEMSEGYVFRLENQIGYSEGSDRVNGGRHVIFISDDVDGNYKKGDIGVMVSAKRFIRIILIELDPNRIVKFQPPRGKAILPLMEVGVMYIYQTYKMQFSAIEFELPEHKWPEGMVHTALTKCKDLSGLVFSRKLSYSDFRVKEEVYEFDRMINSKEQAQRLQEALSEISN